MPAHSQAQANLFRAAEHGATFDKAQQLRDSMSHAQLHDFAATKSKTLPSHVLPRDHTGGDILKKLAGQG